MARKPHRPRAPRRRDSAGPVTRSRAQTRAALVASGLIDRDWIGAQVGAAYGTDESAADRYLDGDGDCSPHPLFEPQWYAASDPQPAEGEDPLSAYLADERARRTVSPHPLVDLQRIVARHPKAAKHPLGPLAFWAARAKEDTPVPVPEGVPAITWGVLRAAALEAAEARHATSEVRLATRRSRQRPAAGPRPPRPRTPEPGADPLVSVVLAARDDGPRLRDVVEMLQRQTFAGWELVVVDNGSADDTPGVVAGIAAFEPRVVPLSVPRGRTSQARNAGLAKARGRYVAFADTWHTWDPDFLAVLAGRLEATSGDLVHAAMRVRDPDGDHYVAIEGTREHLLALEHVDLATVLLRREVVERAGGFDESLEAAESLDLLVRLTQGPTEDTTLPLERRVLVARSARPDGESDEDPRWTARVLERHLVDWQAAAHRPRQPRRLSIVLHTTTDLDRTVRWVTRTMSRVRAGADVELVVVGTRLPRAVELPLAMLLATYPAGRLLAPLARIGPAVATNLGAAETSGEVVVLARTTATPPRDAFHALVVALHDPEVGIAQPLVVDRPGLVASAGAVFGPGRPHPEPFLAGHPVRDAQALTSRVVPAPLSPVVAVRGSALTRLRGYDPLLGDAFPEVELGIRMADHERLRTVVVTQAPIVIKSGQQPRLDAGAEGVLALQERCQVAPGGSEEAWAAAGFEVVGRRWEDRSTAPTVERDPLDAPALSPRTLVRPLRAAVREGPPALRWALDIAAPSGRRGQRWGDAYFARSLAEALERLGQRVTVDTRDVRHRESRDLDDVVLVLRGLDRAAPRPGRVNLEWVISHPDLVTPEELAGFDRVYAASTTWAAATTAATGVQVTPLLQCTDPRLFNPGRAEPDTGAAVLFVGNSRDVYRRSVRSALAVGADVTVYGMDWERFLSPQLIAGHNVSNEEVGALYAAAGVVLNDHHDDMRRDGFLANRLFDVTACAARLVTDEIPGLQEAFGTVVRTFHDEAQLGPLLHDVEGSFATREVRVSLAETVMREHSFDHRAATLLDDAARLRAR